MYISPEHLVRIARETAEKSALSDPHLVAAYLTGSLRTDSPFLGNTTDIDIVFVHAGEAPVRREIIPLTPEIHLDIVHKPRSLYDRPRELRVHPWLGPELYDPLPLYVSMHFFEFIQASVRDRYNDPANVQVRSRRLSEQARLAWSKIKPLPHGPQQVLDYLSSIRLAANSIALQTGNLLAERRFLLQFPERARAAGQPGLAAAPQTLLGGNQIDVATLNGFLPEWQKTFLQAAASSTVDPGISTARLGYYQQACEAILAGETPQAVLWPLLLTWTQSVSVLPQESAVRWRSACAQLGLDEVSFDQRLEELDHFLDAIEALQENLAIDQGL